ncbi:MAG: hypothetical protein PVF68_04490 [Acidobacteriota bacterium]|jgi:transketolase
MELILGKRRGTFIDIAGERVDSHLSDGELASLETHDRIYRALCAVLFNYVPTSGHPGGSISSGRFVTGLLYDSLDLDVSDPERHDADILSYAAGHKALGLYALWALRDEIMRVAAPDLLPEHPRHRLRLEDLIGFRRNPTATGPLFRSLGSRALDGHPTPATPFVWLSTGASGVGVASSIGLAVGARDYYGDGAPRVHIVEGEGGLTPGRVAETLAMAATAGLDNAFLHIDWNQASIDSDHVCRTDGEPGDYVQWDPVELAYFHDWNAILVPDGTDFRQVVAAQRLALSLDNEQPTALIYRTTKGWRYGVEGRASHGAGHKLCSDGFHAAVAPLVEATGQTLPHCDPETQRCQGGREDAVLEECLWEALCVIRRAVEESGSMTEVLADRLRDSRARLVETNRRPRAGAPRVGEVYEVAGAGQPEVPAELAVSPGTTTTLRGQLGAVLRHYNRASDGAFLAAAADLLGSTSVNVAAEEFPAGYYHTRRNPEARLMSVGGICEDAMSGILSGLSTYGRHVGVGSSYGAFLAALGHVAARLHAIGAQATREVFGHPYRPFFLICAHAGLKTGEDGPTHADPQALQLLQGNFPRGTMISLTPWDPAEIWTLVSAALARRPAVIAPFVTRPAEPILDRAALGLAPPSEAATGVYRLRASSKGDGDGALVLQGSGVTYAFVQDALPLLEREGLDLDVYYVASAELFDALPLEQQCRIFPESVARRAMGITGFTLPTMDRWVTSKAGRAATLHPFRRGHYLGSGQADRVLAEAGLDGESQFRAIRSWVREGAAVPR